MNNMSKPSVRARVETIILYVVFAFYILFLLKLLIFSRLSLSDLQSGFQGATRAINLIPFGSIRNYVLSDSANIQRFAFGNVVGNILAFVPLGAYLPLFRRDKRIARNLLPIFIASLLIEIIQGLFGIGTADIDDVILNCLGGLLGIWGYRIFLLILRDQQKVRTAMAILSAMGLPVLLYYLFMIKLRL